MSTHFFGEGNIGSAPDYREFSNGNDEPRRLLRLNIYFDNPVPMKDGTFDDRGGFWAPVELWHRDAEHWSTLYQKGMRVLVEGRTVRDEWEDADENERVTFKIEARRVGILPYRVEGVTECQGTDHGAIPRRVAAAQDRVSDWTSRQPLTMRQLMHPLYQWYSAILFRRHPLIRPSSTDRKPGLCRSGLFAVAPPLDRHAGA
jgi:single-strand DNA-binding protein